MGPFTTALEWASGCSALVLGKPDPTVFQQAARALGVPADEVVMVGDDIWSDVRAAQSAGLHGVLVRTGKFREADLLLDGAQPDAVLPSIQDLPAWWQAEC